MSEAGFACVTLGLWAQPTLVKKSAAVNCEFSSRLTRIKEIEIRQREISELQKQVGTYRKTREIYQQYKASGKNTDFYETHCADITLHEAAKRHFDSTGMKKFPPMDSLKQEWAKLNSENKNLYHGYHGLKEQCMELLKAKDNCERILGINKNAPAHEQNHRDTGAR